MKVLTLWQPWATLIAIGVKKIETRSWPTSYRGPLAIHASKKLDRRIVAIAQQPDIAEPLYNSGIKEIGDMPFGAVVCVCRLVDCCQIVAPPNEPERSFGDYTPGRWAWFLTGAEPLPTPIPAKGRQGLWQWDEVGQP